MAVVVVVAIVASHTMVDCLEPCGKPCALPALVRVTSDDEADVTSSQFLDRGQYLTEFLNARQEV